MQVNRRASPDRRAGFTLLELLVVVAIISILAALTAAAVMRYITVGQSMATEATIRKVTTKLQQQWAEVVNSARKENMDNMFTNPATNLNAMTPIRNISNYDEDRARVMYIKMRLMVEFPINVTEARTPSWNDTTASFVYALAPKQSYLAKIPASVLGSPYESSICLLTALTESRKGISLSAEDFGAGSVKTINFPDGSGGTIACRYLADGWGTPLAYYRWPTGCMELDGMYPGETTNVVRDLQDVDGKLMDAGWWGGASGAYRLAFETNLHSIHSGPLLTPLSYAYYNVPVVASAGPNLQLGLVPGTMAPDGTNADTDNIYSFRLIRPSAGSQGAR
jgi:prepilin-type N-terminal cleavage/methylation domain-containing protein